MKKTLFKYKFGIIGLVLGFLGIFVAIYQDNIREIFYPKAEQSIAKQAFDKTEEFIKTKVLKDSKEINKPVSDSVTMVYYFLGFLAIVFGFLSFIFREIIAYQLHRYLRA